MLEKHLTMQAIRYLAQVCEAFSTLLQTDSVENETSAKHCMLVLSKQIQQIAQNSCEDVPQQNRLWYIRDAMAMLAILVRQQGELLSRSGLPVPSEKDAQSLRLATMTYRDS
jgi:hypothetical protein